CGAKMCHGGVRCAEQDECRAKIEIGFHALRRAHVVRPARGDDLAQQRQRSLQLELLVEVARPLRRGRGRVLGGCAAGERNHAERSEDDASHSDGTRNVTRPNVCVTPVWTTIVVSHVWYPAACTRRRRAPAGTRRSTTLPIPTGRSS